MALDGMVIADMAYELNRDLTGGRITKIAQPEKDELLLTIKQSIPQEGEKTLRSQKRLVLSVNPSLPLIYETEETKDLSDDGTDLLYGASKAFVQCKDTLGLSDRTGACSLF